MRKSLLTLSVALFVTSAFAAMPSLQGGSAMKRENAKQLRGLKHAIKVEKSNKSRNLEIPVFRAASSGNLSMNWTYCEGAYTAIPTNYGEFKAAVQLTPDLATKFAGATLTSISLASPVDAATMEIDYENFVYKYKNPIKEAEVWLTYDLEKEPFAKATGSLSEEGFAWNEIELSEAYTIEPDKAIYIGYTLNVPEIESMFAFVTDNGYPETDYTCYTYSTFTGFDEDWWPEFGDTYKWLKQGDDYGSASIKARINGDMLPVNEVRIVDYLVPQVVAPNDPFSVGILVQNVAANVIDSFTLKMEIEGMSPQEVDVDLIDPIDYLASTVEWIDFNCSLSKNNIPYKLSITKLNGETVNLPEATVSGYLLSISEGYPRNLVFEEGTGTWCGYCVFGITGMEYMAENYGDKGFIGIAVHGGDQMDTMYEGVYQPMEEYCSGFPSAFLNRNRKEDIYPDPEEFEYAYEDYIDVPAFAQIEATLEKGSTDKILKLSTSTKFAMSETDANYSIAYTVLEDEVGPYRQTNYMSGADEDCYGWENLPEQVRMKYNDVARNCSKPYGIENSVPNVTYADEINLFETEIELTDVKDPTKVRVVAMVLNNNTGAIENGCMVKSPAYVGVKNISVSEELPFAYGTKGTLNFRVNAGNSNVFTMDGRCVARGVKGGAINLPAGIYIVNLNGKSLKVAVK